MNSAIRGTAVTLTLIILCSRLLDHFRQVSFLEALSGIGIGPMSEAELVELFARLGASNPAEWARSQIRENIPQLARFLFLRQAWRLVVRNDDSTWIRAQISADPTQPGGGAGTALKRLLAQGASEADLTTVVRVMQWRILSSLCYLLDDPGDLEDEVKDIAWRLFQVNDKDEPVAVLAGLHESVLETEPSGAEMRLR